MSGMYGSVAADHLKQPRNLGRPDTFDAMGQVDHPATDTLVTVYLWRDQPADGPITIREARFRAFGCGGCIIAGSMLTELLRGLPLSDAAQLDSSAIHRALDEGLPADQRYCADLVVAALRLALADTNEAGRSHLRPTP